MLADIGAKHVEVEREMREDVGDACRRAASRPQTARARRRRRRRCRAVQSVVGTSAMPPSRPFSGRLRSSTAPSLADRDEGRAAPLRPLGLRRLARRSSGSPRRCARQSSLSGQSMQGGRFGVQIVAPRSIIACAKSPGRVGRHQRLHASRGSPAWRPAAASRSRRAAHHPLDIAVDHGGRPVEGDRRDRRRRVGADARQRAQAVLVSGKRPPGSAATISAHFLRLRARE